MAGPLEPENRTIFRKTAKDRMFNGSFRPDKLTFRSVFGRKRKIFFGSAKTFVSDAKIFFGSAKFFFGSAKTWFCGDDFAKNKHIRPSLEEFR